MHLVLVGEEETMLLHVGEYGFSHPDLDYSYDSGESGFDNPGYRGEAEAHAPISDPYGRESICWIET